MRRRSVGRHEIVGERQDVLPALDRVRDGALVGFAAFELRAGVLVGGPRAGGGQQCERGEGCEECLFHLSCCDGLLLSFFAAWTGRNEISAMAVTPIARPMS